MTSPAERQFAVFRRGEIREQILLGFREGLRQLLDPETGQAFTEDKIQRVTAPPGRFWSEADAIDIVGLGQQKRAEFLAQQTRITRAGTAWLENYHAPLWGAVRFPAAGGAGEVSATGTPGTTWLGSTTVPDTLAHFARDPAGNRYQVFVGGTAGAGGTATLTLLGIDGGAQTNPATGTLLKWEAPPSGSTPECTVTSSPGFSGGVDAETDQQFADRMAAEVRHKAASGNWAHFRAWARQASPSVEDAFVYPCALHAGSALVCVTQKRGTTLGPTARFPSLATLTAATAYLTPPASPVVPSRPFVVVVPPVGELTNMVMALALPRASPAGWTDLTPFPPLGAATTEECTITTITTQQDIEITTTAGAGQLPGGVTGPLAGVSLMVWWPLTSEFVVLDVDTVEDVGGGVYNVLLGTAPSVTLFVGQFVGPATARHPAISEAVVAYFDSLGPGEVIDLAADVRSSRAFRRPKPSEESPSRSGQAILTVISEALGAPLADSSLAKNTVTTPTLPANVTDGPRLLAPFSVGVYHLA